MIARQLSIFLELLNKPRVTASYLAQKYEVSTRTIMRDIDCIEDSLQTSLCRTRGKDGGISISQEYKLNSIIMAHSEMEFLKDIASHIQDTVTREKYNNIVYKVTSVSRPKDSTISSSSLYINHDTPSQRRIVDKINLLEQAMNELREVTITYHDFKDNVTKRTIRPATFILNNNEWYVYSWCLLKKGFRSFKLSRITSLTLEDAHFAPIKEYPKDYKFEFGEKKPKVDILLKVNTKAKYNIQEWLGIENVWSSKSGDIMASSTQELDDNLICKLLSFGDQISVIEPKIVKNKMLEMIKVIQNITEV